MEIPTFKGGLDKPLNIMVMPCLKHLLVASLQFIFFTGLIAQIEYTSTDYISPGEDYYYSQTTANSSSIDLELKGPDLSWDFSENTAQIQEITECLTPSQSGYESAFFFSCLVQGYNALQCLTLFNQLADQAIRNEGPAQLGFFSSAELVRFQMKESDELLETMAGLQLQTDTGSTELVIIYTDPDSLLLFPVQYEDTLSSKGKIHLDLTTIGVDVIFNSTQHRNYKVDAWGELTTPYRHYKSTLRVRTDLVRFDTLIIGGVPTPLETPITQYHWYAKEFGLPVLEVIQQSELPDLLLVNYIDTVQCFQPEATFNFTPEDIFLDENGMAEVNFFSNSFNADQFTWDFGNGSQSSSPNPGTVYSAAGDYEVSLIACNSNCTPIECDTVLLNLTVNDTTSGLFQIEKPGEVEIFPNPFDNTLSLTTPFQEKVDLHLYNAQGLLIGSQVLAPNQRDISLRPDLPMGVYTILFNTGSKQYFARVVRMKN